MGIPSTMLMWPAFLFAARHRVNDWRRDSNKLDPVRLAFGRALPWRSRAVSARFLKNVVSLSPRVDFDRVDLTHGCQFDAMLAATSRAGSIAGMVRQLRRPAQLKKIAARCI